MNICKYLKGQVVIEYMLRLFGGYIFCIVTFFVLGLYGLSYACSPAGSACTATITCCCNHTACASPNCRCGDITMAGTCTADGGGTLVCVPNGNPDCAWTSRPCVSCTMCGGGCTACSDCCIAPSAVTNIVTTPSSPIGLGTVITWTATSSWGYDTGKTAGTCAGCNTCSLTTANTHYKLLIDSVDRTSICLENVGGKLPSNKCTLNSNPTDLIGQTKTIVIRSSNGCASADASINRKFSSSPTVDSVKVSKTNSSFHYHCGFYSTQSTCESNPLCIWNATGAGNAVCQMYVSSTATATNKTNNTFYLQSEFLDPDGHGDLSGLSWWFSDVDTQSKAKQLSSPTTNVTRYESYIALWKDNIRTGASGTTWVLRGLYHIDTYPYACNCGIAAALKKDCDGSHLDAVTCSTKGSVSACNDSCSVLSQADCSSNTNCEWNDYWYSCESKCGWNYQYGYCQPVNLASGCKYAGGDGYRRYSWMISTDPRTSTYWSNGIVNPTTGSYSICSNGTALGRDSYTTTNCSADTGFQLKVEGYSTSGSNKLIVNSRYQVVNPNSNAELYLRLYVTDKYSLYAPGHQWAQEMIGKDGYKPCIWNNSTLNWECFVLTVNRPFKIFVDNTPPGGGIAVETDGVGQGQVRLVITGGDSLIGFNGGGLRGGFFATDNSDYGISNIRIASGTPATVVSNTCSSNLSGATSVNCQVVVGGLSGGMDYEFMATLTDLAGNRTEITSTFFYAGAWFETVKGDLYSNGLISNSIPVSGRYTSEYLLYSGTSVSLGDSMSGSVWKFGSYAEGNNKSTWYDELMDIAEINTGTKFPFPSITSGNLENGNSGVFTSNPSNFTVSGDSCRGQKVIFVPGNLTIANNFYVMDDSYGCLFIVSGNLTINTNINTLQAGFIVGGNVIVPNSYNQLVITGFVFAHGQVKIDTSDTFCPGGKCGRDLFVTDNLLNPSEQFNYDPRYIVLMREYLGRKKIENFTCGTVDRDECDY